MIGDVHLACDLPLTARLRAQAAALLVPGALLACGAVVGFGSAAWIHSGWPQSMPPDLVDLIVPPRVRRRTGPDGPRIRQMRLPGDQVQLIAGLPVTTAARTVADLARDLPPTRAQTAMAAVGQATGITASDVLRCLDAMPRARGSVRAREVVEAW